MYDVSRVSSSSGSMAAAWPSRQQLCAPGQLVGALQQRQRLTGGSQQVQRGVAVGLAVPPPSARLVAAAHHALHAVGRQLASSLPTGT